MKFETMKQHLCHAQKQSESDEKNTDSTKKNALTYLKVEGKKHFLTFCHLCRLLYSIIDDWNYFVAEFIAKVMSWYKNWSEKDTKL